MRRLLSNNKRKLAILALPFLLFVMACNPPAGWKVLDSTHMAHATQIHGDYDPITELDRWCDLVRSCPGWDTPDVTFWAYVEYFYWTGSSWVRYDDRWESVTCEQLGPNVGNCYRWWL